jgi:hypothetical protein
VESQAIAVRKEGKKKKLFTLALTLPAFRRRAAVKNEGRKKGSY